MKPILTLCLTLLCATTLAAQSITPRDGWVVIPTQKPHATLLDDLKAAVKANGMGVVTQAGPTGAARARGITIPENRVVGVFNNDFAVKVLALSTAAMIEAPVRFYVTEEPDGTATLSYKTPSFVYSPYMDEAGPELATLAEELDSRFAAIAAAATD
ncbi:DUF302 domain-containing protein [Roseobacter sinensis]|uniref:DUF302 domain-containing protein n=1 Tax=Roseobacter sinensis TaxID=2931391 RepID=A0ABT3BDN0_9RHOB|nr:DUF302 domain-containing protein [Roseobacter sp. WL0113]MCV3271678.1 DUF302 domain-containing protein [Roseobacter sp. WL0113]